MDFVVYASGQSTVLLIPDFFLPPIEAQRAYAPLTVCGRISAFAGGATLWRRFEAAIDAHAFVAVSIAEMERILGIDHPFLVQFRKTAARRGALFGTSPLAPEAGSPAGNV